MVDDPRAELSRLWEEHLAAPPPYEFGELEERFGWAADRVETQTIPNAARLLYVWGGADLHLYDTYVSGYISEILRGRRGGADVLEDVEPDTRLARYFDLCSSEAKDEETRHKVDACRDYFERLNRMLEVGRRVPERRRAGRTGPS